MITLKKGDNGPFVEMLELALQRAGYNLPINEEFNENLELIKRFSDAGINKINLDMLYWCNSGYEQTLAKKISPLSVLGGNGALKELLKKEWVTQVSASVLKSRVKRNLKTAR